MEIERLHFDWCTCVSETSETPAARGVDSLCLGGAGASACTASGPDSPADAHTRLSCAPCVRLTPLAARLCRDPAFSRLLAPPTPPMPALATLAPSSPRAGLRTTRPSLRALPHCPPTLHRCWSDFQAIWCRDGRERDDFLLRQPRAAAVLLRGMDQGKSHPGNPIPGSA